MSGRIVVLGATGYTGGLTARALVDSGASPVLAARSPERLDRLAHELGGLETHVADVSDPATVRSLVERGDVLISTVGPFARWGDTAIDAAIATGATYFDTTGEPEFIRRVYEQYGPAAARAGTAVLTAFGFDFVPGNLAAELVLRAAGPQATRLEVGYFSRGSSSGISGGTKASSAGAVLSPSFAVRRGRLRRERTGARVGRFVLDDGTVLQGISVGGSEHFAVRSLHPQLSDIDVLLERPGMGGMVTPALTALLVVANKIPGVGAKLYSMLGSEGSTGGPDAEARSASGSLVVADARSASGELIQRVVMQGPNGYDFTARILAWASTEATRVGITETGAVGPVAAFGLGPLRVAAETAGLRQESASLPS
jgi:NAD(P)-dependent dehydrogenase (short-subunit alcohol dehydrogenase family)